MALNPGELIKAQLGSAGISASEIARAIGADRSHLSQVLNGHFALTPELALRLSQALGERPQTWLTLQMEWDLAQAKEKLKKDGVKIKKVVK